MAQILFDPIDQTQVIDIAQLGTPLGAILHLRVDNVTTGVNTAIIVGGVPTGKIPTAKTDDQLSIMIMIWNSGDAAGNVYYRIYSTAPAFDTGQVWFTLNPGSGTAALNHAIGKMPATNCQVTVEAGH